MPNNKKRIITQKVLPIIQEITFPLLSLGIDDFYHDITFSNNKMAMLTNNETTFNSYYDEQLPAIFTNEQGRTLQPGLYLLKKIIQEEPNITKILPYLHERFCFASALIIVEHEKDCQHTFTFCSRLDDVLFTHNIINNLDYLKNFIINYKIKANVIIEQAKLNKNHVIIANSNQANKIFANNAKKNTIKVKSDECLLLTHKDTNTAIALSYRQSQCISFLMQGYSIKEIARKVNLSPRTIEHYFEKIRFILKCKNNKELVLNYYTQIK